MAKKKAMTGFKIIRPGMRYYFDDSLSVCPECNSNDIQYNGRVNGTTRSANFKCNTCLCKFWKERTKESEPEGYVPQPAGATDS